MYYNTYSCVLVIAYYSIIHQVQHNCAGYIHVQMSCSFITVDLDINSLLISTGMILHVTPHSQQTII